MKAHTRSVIGLAVVVMALGLFSVVTADDAVTMEGSFVWAREEGDQTGDLRAVFTPAGDAAWNVTFHFEWEDEPHVYTGSAQGNLDNGELEGEVEGDDEDHKIKFHFSGTVDGGSFSGTHSYYNKDGDLEPSGTLELNHQG